MGDTPKKIIGKRWLRDFTSEGEVYLPEELAKPSRMREGFVLREDGSYLDLGAGARDEATEDAGQWTLDANEVLTLVPGRVGAARRVEVVNVGDERLELRSAVEHRKVIVFDLGDTLEHDEVLLPGAEELLGAVAALTDQSGTTAAVVLLSDWTLPSEPDELERDMNDYYALLERLGLREYFEPVHRRVTLSSELGVYKPDPTLFRAALDKLCPGTPFELAIFITENLKHVEAARALGMTAIHFMGPDSGSLSDLLEPIEEFVRS